MWHHNKILLSIFLLLSQMPAQFTATLPTPVDCNFERTAENTLGFCGWRPDSENGIRIWHTGNAVLVDSVNSVVRSSSGGERFAFVQGRYGAPTEGSLRSPLVHDRLEQRRLLRLTYWKAAVSPSLDICIEEDPGEPLRCIDTIQGPGQQQWVRRSVEVPGEERPYRVVLKARNLLAAEDIIGIDDIQLLEAEGENAIENSPAITGQFLTAAAQPKNPFDGIEEMATKGEEMPKTRIFPVPSNSASQKSTRKSTHQQLPKPMAEEQPPVLQPLIRPQIRLSPSGNVQMGSSLDASGFGLQQPANSFNSVLARPTMLMNGVTAGSGANPFPNFPSLPFGTSLFSPTSSSTARPRARFVEDGEHCRAVSCSFMEGTCNWDLGPGWHSTSHGSTSIESPATSSRLASAQFKPPVASYLDFDLWMSDDAELTVSERIEGNGEEGGFALLGMAQPAAGQSINEIQLFTRKGATDGGWHRFRVPLRPSFSPVRLLFLAALSAPTNAFISLSNIKLVNSNGIEIGCQGVDEKSGSGDVGTSTSDSGNGEKMAPQQLGETLQNNDRTLLADIGLDWLARQPAPLQLSPTLGSAGAAPFPAPPPFPLPTALQQQPQRFHGNRQQAAAQLAPFNPLKPMFEGIAPIVPLQGNPPRLTALMDELPTHTHLHQHKNNNEFPQLLTPLALPPASASGTARPPMGKKQPPMAVEEERKGLTKFELDEGEDESNQPQQLYGATPIPTEQSEALLPFRGGPAEEDETATPEGPKQQQELQRENSELTLLPRSRSKQLHQGRQMQPGAEDWPNMLDMGGQQRREEAKKLPSSVTSVLASSHHRGWVEHAGEAGQMEFFRWRRS